MLDKTNNNHLLEIEKKIDLFAQTPEDYFLHSNQIDSQEILNLTKNIYDYTKNNDYKVIPAGIPELLVKDVDVEQIWEELQLQNIPLYKYANTQIKNYSKNPERFNKSASEKQKKSKLSQNKNKKYDVNSSEDEEMEDIEEMEEDSFDEEEEINEMEDENQYSDDELNSDSDKENKLVEEFENEENMEEADFFDEDQMLDFVDRFEQKDMNFDDEEESSDFDELYEEGAEFGNIEDSLIENYQEEPLSSYQKRKKEIEKQVEELEEKNLATKDWTMKGEASAKHRQENSLLEEFLEFEHGARPVPLITNETTTDIEEIIKRRILDDAFDDVIRKKEIQTDFKPRVELSHEKSKLSLGQEYEKDYIEEKYGSTKKDELTEKHEEIDHLFKKLVHKLDSLSNFSYTPKQATEEIKVIPNVGAISMEEIVPISVNDSNLLAPEEMYKKNKANSKSEYELSQEDRKKKRKNQKRLKQKQSKDKENQKKHLTKLNPELENKYSKEKNLKDMKNSKNTIKDIEEKSAPKSTALFKQLQEETTTLIAEKTARSSSNTQQKKQKKKSQTNVFKL